MNTMTMKTSYSSSLISSYIPNRESGSIFFIFGWITYRSRGTIGRSPLACGQQNTGHLPNTKQGRSWAKNTETRSPYITWSDSTLDKNPTVE